jgi:hypothetical protein
METTSFLQNISRDLREIQTQAEKFVDLPPQQLNHKTTAADWSILECFEHLNRYNQYYINVLETAIGKNNLPPQKEVKSTWIGKKSIAMMHPSNIKKQKTFKKMNPSGSMLSLDVLKTFLRDQEKLASFLSRAELINLNSKTVPVEFFKLLKMTIGECISFIVVHEQRHLLQAKNLLAFLRQQIPSIA